ncbi:MAG: DUF1801 domain-containing protein [Phycisphaeraceae bacterium]|nr:DUF1801 domain-containing protein [Phycisphaerales bacterium]MCB9860385.1 DUF1801 domain-containing protein [Phycisphaeraceae bacterium]
MAQARSKAVTDFINNAPESQQKTLNNIRAMIRKALPMTTEEMSPNNFPVYTFGSQRWVAGIGTTSKCPMLYVMDQKVLNRFEKRLGNLRSGKSCVQFRASKQVTLDELSDIAREMLSAIAADLSD